MRGARPRPPAQPLGKRSPFVHHPLRVDLDDDFLAWLRSLGAPAEKGDLAGAYSFPHELNARRELLHTEQADDCVAWFVEFHASTGERTLTEPSQRKVLRNAPLQGTVDVAYGPIAFNVNLHVCVPLRRKGFGTALYGAELTLYSHWRLREVQLSAQDEGPFFFLTKQGFQPAEPEELRRSYEEWASDHPECPPQAPADPRHYPESFLKDPTVCGILLLYKVLP